MGSSLDWKNRTAIISGGSSGLGLALARSLAKQGANLVIIGRDPDRLKATEKQALGLGAASVLTLPLDVRDLSKPTATDVQTQSASLRDVLAVQGCDLLINAVGKSDRGLIGQLSEKDLIEQFETNVLSTHAMTKLCWTALCANRGVVVNIASLAGIVAGPAMGGYSMAKHALVGLHRQWRLESASTGVHFLLVCPGPIAREDSNRRYDELIESRGLDPAAQSPGGGVALSRIDPDDLSRRILRAAQERRLELIVPSKVRILAMLAAVWPSLADRIIRKKMKRT
ncbi:MAG: SDR family NAD(P)-dependent oxidoreductase [Planctomycetaceae bacterium]|jgi:short-subunit dehydrogenase|nr:SDR family NAD(P)-dependent oxidoreductase [Planctomycetaceae bacterium]